MKKNLWNFFLTAAYVNKGGSSFTMFGFEPKRECRQYGPVVDPTGPFLFRAQRPSALPSPGITPKK